MTRLFIQSLLAKQGLSQNKLAAELGLSQPAINKALKKDDSRYEGTRRKILLHLGYEVREKIVKIK